MYKRDSFPSTPEVDSDLRFWALTEILFALERSCCSQSTLPLQYSTHTGSSGWLTQPEFCAGITAGLTL